MVSEENAGAREVMILLFSEALQSQPKYCTIKLPTGARQW